MVDYHFYFVHVKITEKYYQNFVKYKKYVLKVMYKLAMKS